jgi:methylmalonyl-CoA/ethylmalonyl-CoA epimerase
MNVTHIHHLNFIVRDLEDGIRRFAATLGCSANDFIRDQLTGRNVATARIKLGETWLVLVSPLSDQGVPAEHLRQHGEGFFLLSLGVDDFAPAVAGLQQQGIAMTAEHSRQGLDNWQVWDVDANATLQIQIQYCKESD